ncbi:MAG: hypothetical protein ACRDHB_10465, partial [Actinomycetota bacterium]
LKDEARRARADAEEAEPATDQAQVEQPSGGALEPPGPPGATAAAAGAVGAVGAWEALDDEPPGPSESTGQGEPGEAEAPAPPEPPPAEEVTAPWSQVGETTPPTEESSADDPLVSAWESAFSGDAGETALGDERPRREEEGEPSLRELFWGEE